MMDFTGQVVFITGSSTGIGAAVGAFEPCLFQRVTG